MSRKGTTAVLLLLLINKHPGLTARQLAVTYWPETRKDPHRARQMAVLLRKLWKKGIVRIRYNAKGYAVYFLADFGHELCERYRDQTYPVHSRYRTGGPGD